MSSAEKRNKKQKMKNHPVKFSFTPDGDHLAVLSPDDGIVKIWNTGTGKIVTEWTDQDRNSAINYSCMLCGFFGKKHKKETRLLSLVLGTVAGEVMAIESSTGEKKWINSDCGSCGISALYFADKGCVIYVVGMDGTMHELNSETGESLTKFRASRKPFSSVSLSPGENFLVVASDKIRLISLKDKKETAKFTSDKGPVQYVAVSDSGEHVVSSAVGEKKLKVQYCDSNDRTKNSWTFLNMKSPPLILECQSSKEKGLAVVSISQKGVAYIWRLMSLSESGVMVNRILVKSQEGNKEHNSGKDRQFRVIATKICKSGKNEPLSVLVAYGALDDLRFKTLEVPNHAEDIHLVMDDEVSLNQNIIGNDQQNNISNDKEDDGELHNPEVEATAVPSQKKKGKKRTASQLDSSFGGNVFSAEIAYEEGCEPHMDEPTMEEKLARLDLVDKDRAKSSTSQEAFPTATPPSADSVDILLRQALRADDQALLLDCLYTRDEKVIAKSISRLNPADVLRLLDSLASMIQSRGAVLVCVLPWLRSLLSQHASSIVSQESSLLILNSLFQIIQSRISTFGIALQLSSSLDYLFAGIPEGEAEDEGMITAVVYEDKDSDEDESGDAMETDEELGPATEFQDSDASEVMSD